MLATLLACHEPALRDMTSHFQGALAVPPTLDPTPAPPGGALQQAARAGRRLRGLQVFPSPPVLCQTAGSTGLPTRSHPQHQAVAQARIVAPTR